MEIDEIYTAFTNELAELELYRSAINDTTTQELKRFSEYVKQTSDTADDLPPYQSSQVMIFRDPRTGEVIPYSFRESFAEDRFRIVEKQKNKQYCWLLVEAYEEFEDYIESIFAYLGKRDPNAWPLEDYGNVKLPELTSKDFRWHLDTVRKNYRRDTKRILNKLRGLYKQLETIENKNALGINLRLAIELIENIRHQIVHTRGKVENLDIFCERILKNCGLWSNGNPKHEYRRFIKSYFRQEADVNNISLVEKRALPNNIPLNAYYDICGHLFECMMAYAVEIWRCVKGI